MAKPRNRNFLTVLIALTFVVVQFAGSAVLDTRHAVAAEVHSTFDDHAAGHEDGPSACAGHCASHLPHHVYVSDVAAYSPIDLPGPVRLFVSSPWYSGPTTLPPVPPPIS